VSKSSINAEIAALREWGVVPSTNRFAMLQQIRQTTLIVYGNKDVVVIPINALLLVQHLPNAQLIIYPDASHLAFSQHAETFLKHVQLFFQGSAAA
jgi:pimeloyl-ACP methyl ester carboxylesterase